MATRHPLVLNGGQIEQLQDGDSVPAADKLATARTISLSGDAAGSASFDGSGNVSIATTVADDSHNHVIGNVDGLQSALDGKAASSHTHSYAPVSHTHGGGDITSAVANATSAASCSGNAATATKLATARTISLTGDVTGSASFDGSANASITATVANDSHSHDTQYYKKAEAVPSGADLNDYTVPGFYYCSSTATASTMSNIPVARAFSLRVYLSAGVTQHWQGYNTSDVYVRSYYSTSGWTAWSKLSLDGHTHAGTDVTSAVANATNATTAASCSGNAATATKLATARTISLTGDVTGSASFDGSGNAAITATVADDSHNHTIANVDSLQTALDGKAASSHTHAGTDVTSAVANATNATTAGSCSGNAATATKLATARTISLTGDVTGSASFNGSADVSITATVADDSHNHTIANVDSLQTTLDGKAASSHTHAGTDVTSAVANATTAAACSGNAATATKLATARTISLTGDVTGSASFDGSANASITATVADDSHNHVISNVDGLQTALDGKPNILSERSLSVTTTNWVTIATCSTGRAYGEFYVYDIDSGRHNMVKIIASTSCGQNTVVALCGNRHGSRTIAHVRILYNTADRTYGGAKLQVYCENPTFILRVRRVFTDQFPGWTSWNDVNPVVDGTPSGWAEDSTTRFDDITSTAYSLSGNLSGNATNATTAASCSGNAATATKLATARTISLTGDVTGSASFDGSANASITATVANDSHTHTGGNITSAVANATTAASCSGNAATATKLATARTISLTGDVTGSASFDGSANASITATVVDDSHNHTIANVDSLQTALDGKAATSHTHDYLPTTGKAADSDKLDGYNSAAAGTASTVPVRDSSGDITTRLFKSTYANQATISGALAFRTNNTTDNYIRFCSDMAAVRTFIGCAATSHTHSYAPIPTSSTLPVGTICVCINMSTSDISSGDTIAGSYLKPYSHVDGGTNLGGTAQAGTWKNIHGATVYRAADSMSRYGGLFVRTA